MSMDINELKKYEEYEKEEITISKWLEARQGRAFTYEEIYTNLKGSMLVVPNEKGSIFTWENAFALSFNALRLYNFLGKLKQMTDSGKIKMKVANGEEYYYVE